MLAVHPRQHPLPGHRDGRHALAARGLPARRAALRGAARALRQERGRRRASGGSTPRPRRSAARRRRSRFPDGVYEAESYIDWRRPTADEPSAIKVSVTIAGGDMTIDLSGCSPQREGGVNSRTLAGALHRLQGAHRAAGAGERGLVLGAQGHHPRRQHDDGALPGADGELEPAAADRRRHDLLALAPGDPGPRFRRRTAARSGGAVRSSGVDRDRKRASCCRASRAAAGAARPFEDGESASVSVCQGDVRNAPIENMELEGPGARREARGCGRTPAARGSFAAASGLDVRVRKLVDGTLEPGANGRQTAAAVRALGREARRTASDKLLQLPDETDWRSVDASWYDVPANTRAMVAQRGRRRLGRSAGAGPGARALRRTGGVRVAAGGPTGVRRGAPDERRRARGRPASHRGAAGGAAHRA